MKTVYEELTKMKIGKVLMNEPLANHTTLKVGGPAAIFIEPNSIEDLQTLIKSISKKDIPWKVIGRGSNLLITDDGFDGAIIKINSPLSNLNINGTEVKVGAGHSLISLAMLVYRQGLTGLEFASGIPGSVGGAVYMNAGAHGSNIASVLSKARILFNDGCLKWLTNEEMEFSYRTSKIQKEQNGIILEAVFQLEYGDKEKIREVMQNNKQYRKETQPWESPCAGSIFRNPLPNYAGKLIEDAGLKGYSIGGAKISEMHSNFIVNTGSAKASDVLQLIDFIKMEIKKLYNIDLQTEVEIIVQK